MSLWEKIKSVKDTLEAKVSERHRKGKRSAEKHLLALPREIREAGETVQAFCKALKIEPEIVFCSEGYGWPLLLEDSSTSRERADMRSLSMSEQNMRRSRPRST